MKSEKYICKNCGSNEFVTQLNYYEVYMAQNDKIVLQEVVSTNDVTELFCRECSDKLNFNDNDLE